MTQTPGTTGQTPGQVIQGAAQSTVDGQTPDTGDRQSDAGPQGCSTSAPQPASEKLGSEDKSKKQGKQVGDVVKNKVIEKSRQTSGQSEDTLSDESSSSQKKNQPRRSNRKKPKKSK